VDIYAMGHLIKAACHGLEGRLAQKANALAALCLANDRDDRPRSGGALADAINTVLIDDGRQTDAELLHDQLSPWWCCASSQQPPALP
jgi:hypothetical protein